MSSEPSPSVDPVLHLHHRYIKAATAADLQTIMDLYADDVVLMPPNEPSLYGKAEVREWHEEYFEHFAIVTLAETERDVIVMDAWVMERWAYTVAIAPTKGGDRIRDDGRWSILWKRQSDGNWRMVQGMFNSIRPIGSGTSRFISRMASRNKQIGKDSL